MPADRHKPLSEWFSRWNSPLRKFLSRRNAVAKADLDDVAQEVFLRLLRSDRMELINSPQAYLFQMARHVAVEWAMRARNRMPHDPAWLEELGHGPTRQTVVDSFLGYASRTFARDPTTASEWRALFLQATPQSTRGGGLFPVDHDQWHVTLAGVGRDYPPTDEAGFLEFARSIRSTILFDAIRDAQPTSTISAYRRTENQLRHFDDLPSWPTGFVVLGDAACCFNPVYGQGMTVAAIEACAAAAEPPRAAARRR